MNAPPLDGLTILDLSRVLSGPYCTMLAADMGARVIKIEHPDRGDDTRAWGPPFVGGESAYYLSINRNKESVAVDFKDAGGKAIVEQLAGRADIVVENFRPGTLDALGLGYDVLGQRHPNLIWVSISGYGQNGPRRAEPGYDAVAQAEGGLMSVTGAAGGEAVRLGVAIADIASGMFAFQGLLLALIARGRSGRGQRVDVSLLDSVTALLTYQASRWLLAHEMPTRSGNRHMTIAPYDTFAAADGTVVLAVGNDAQWQRLCSALNRPELGADPRFTTNELRVRNYPALRGVLAPIFEAATRQAMIDGLRAAGVPCGSVRSVDEALRDPQTLAREMVVSVDHPALGPLRVLGVPTKLADTPGRIQSAPPRLGEHTAAVLQNDLRMAPAEIAALVDRGTIRT